MLVMVSLHVLAFFWVRRRLDLLFMLACGVVRCFSLSIGDFILGTVPSIRSAKIINSHQKPIIFQQKNEAQKLFPFFLGRFKNNMYLCRIKLLLNLKMMV